MSLWIKRDVELKRNKKTYRLAQLLAQGGGTLFGGRDDTAWRAIAAELLCSLWGYAFEHFPDGVLTDAPDASLREAVYPFLEDTEWARGDVRELLLRSGHLDRTPEGQIVIHNWLEWSGGEAVRMANDRTRKRLKRAEASKRKPGTRPAKHAGRVQPPIALEEKSREEQRRAEPKEQQQPAAAPALPAKSSALTLDYATRCTIAANQALEQLLAGAYRPLVATVEQSTAAAWEAAGIPVELAAQVVAERTAAFRSTVFNRQPNTLRYFDAAVREAAAKVQADGAPRPLKDYERMEEAARREQERERAEAGS